MANLINIGLLILALSAEDVTTIALSWTLLDGIAILTEHLLIGVPPQKSTINLLGRWLSTLLIIGAALSQMPPDPQLDPHIWSHFSGTLFFLGVAIRMGLIPLGAGIAYPKQEYRGVWTILNFQNPLLGLALLSRWPAQNLRQRSGFRGCLCYWLCGDSLTRSFGLTALKRPKDSPIGSRR